MFTAAPPNVDLAPECFGDGTLLVHSGGTWQLESGFLSSAAVEREFGADPPERVRFDTTALGAWDNGILALMVKISALSRAHGSEFDVSGLPDGLERLLGLAEAVSEKDDARAEDAERRFIDRIGTKALETQSLFRDDLELPGRTDLGSAPGPSRSTMTLTPGARPLPSEDSHRWWPQGAVCGSA